MKEFFKFLVSKTFLKHISIALVLVITIFWGIFKYLDHFTRHGETIAVPDYTGVGVKELDSFTEGKKVRYMVIDSIYEDGAKKGVVARQDPEKGTKVKEDRVVYLYVTSILPPSVAMPKLQDMSLRQATAILETYGLRLGGVTQKRDQCLNCVLEQLVKGKKIAPGTMIEKNTKVYLVVGKGTEEDEDDGENGPTLRDTL